MADFDQTLNALLSDSEAMEQIMALADRLNPETSPPSDSAEEQVTGAEPLPGQETDLTAILRRLLPLLRAQRGISAQAEELLRSLRPFLKEARREKLDRAIRYAGLAQTARLAYGLWKDGELHF